MDPRLRAVLASRADYPDVPPWTLRETLAREKEAIGFYLSGHPAERLGVELSRFGVITTAMLLSSEPWSRVRLGGMVEQQHPPPALPGGGGAHQARRARAQHDGVVLAGMGRGLRLRHGARR